jgi:hypothetical protein
MVSQGDADPVFDLKMYNAATAAETMQTAKIPYSHLFEAQFLPDRKLQYSIDGCCRAFKKDRLANNVRHEPRKCFSVGRSYCFDRQPWFYQNGLPPVGQIKPSIVKIPSLAEYSSGDAKRVRLYFFNHLRNALCALAIGAQDQRIFDILFPGKQLLYCVVLHYGE